MVNYSRFSPSPKAQPDNREQTQLGGESESCMAVLNNFYGDGEQFSHIIKHNFMDLRHKGVCVCECVMLRIKFRYVLLL